MNKQSIFLAGIFTLVLAALPMAVYAQGLPDEEVLVEQNFDARLASAERFLLNPEFPQLDTTKLDYNFTIRERQLDYQYQPPEIRALGVGRSEPATSYSHYLRAGHGVPGNPVLDAFTSFRGKSGGWYAKGSHFGIDNRNDIENQYIAKTNFGVGGEYILSPMFFVDGDINYTYRANDLYGYDQKVDSFSREDARRRFNIFRANLGFGSKESNAMGMSYYLNTSYQNTSDNLSASDDDISVLGQLNWNLTENQAVSVQGKGQFVTFTDSSSIELAANVFGLRSAYSYSNSSFSTSLGFFFGSGSDERLFFPEVDINYSFVEDQLIGFLGSEASLSPQNFSLLSRRNPYFSTTMDSIYLLNQWEVYTGVKGKFKKIQYMLELSYQNFENLAFYTQKSADSRFFDAIYESGNNLDLSLYASYSPVERLSTSITLNAKFFSLDSLEMPIHTPTFTIDLRTDYQLFSESLNLWLDLRYQNGVDYIDTENEVQSLDNLFDLSLGADYFIGENWGIFLNANNIFDNTRQRWFQYPIIGRNFSGGVLFRF
ncbi:MAG: hypothetical protein GVX96_01575 [Bacteroidetes bacterium]|jgi:hypothetical protein|nr:hypothetical protein [Bacteroidota bacterium]